jgi:hypothetical protein
MNSIYSKYFQKSRSFLYPILGIKKGSYTTPIGTYIAIENLIDADETKLICTFKEDSSKEFEKFEEQMLITNPLFDRILEVDGYKLYIFDLKVYESDWFNFILGKYSKLSSTIKKAIKTYYGEKSAEYKYMESYLFPEKYFEDYAKILDVSIDDLKQIGELCDPCDLEKETLILKNLETLKKDN